MDHVALDTTKTKFEISFPLFISLAALLTHQGQIIREQVDFIGISGLFSDNIGRLELHRCLEEARWFKQRHRYLQLTRFCNF